MGEITKLFLTETLDVRLHGTFLLEHDNLTYAECFLGVV